MAGEALFAVGARVWVRAAGGAGDGGPAYRAASVVEVQHSAVVVELDGGAGREAVQQADCYLRNEQDGVELVVEVGRGGAPCARCHRARGLPRTVRLGHADGAGGWGWAKGLGDWDAACGSYGQACPVG
jgi:hypothetical protein